MEIMKPFDVTDTTLTSSSITEPDIASGEVEWADPKSVTTFPTPSAGMYLDGSVLGRDGFIYLVGNSSKVVKVDTAANSSVEFAAPAGFYRDCENGNDGDIYAIGQTGVVLKIDTALSSTSTFGAYTNNYHTCSKSRGMIYCIGVSDIMKIDPSNDTVSFFGAYSGNYYDSTVAGNGDIYCVGDSGSILRISPATDTAVEITSFSVPQTFNCVTASDGNAYSVRSSGVMKIDVSNDTVSFFGDVSTGIALMCASVGGDGLIYAAGGINPSNDIVTVDIASKEIGIFGSYTGSGLTMSKSNAGDLYIGGQSTGDSILLVSSGYKVGDEVILTSTSKVYRSASGFNKDKPEVGVALIPPTWVELRYTNKYRMFNDAKDSKSTATTDIVTEFDFNKSVTTVATLGVIGTSVKVTVTDPIDGIVYEVEKETANAAVNDFWPWFFEPYTFREDLIFDGIAPGYQDTTVKVEIKAASGERAVGRVLSGLPINIGVTNEPTTVGRQNFTLRTRDGFGNLTITPKRSIKVLNYDVAVNKNDLDSTDRVLESVGKIPALYIGEGDLESMICFGMAEDYRMDHNSAFSNMRLEVKEI